MSEEFNKFGIDIIKSQAQGLGLMEKLMAVAQPSSVYSAPVIAGEHTVITASEVSVGMGFGYGGGGGTGPQPTSSEMESGEKPQAPSGGVGGGGGGGGVSTGRPVAVISVGPEGVKVRPVIDVSKLALAYLTMMLSLFAMMRSMRKASRR